jgi:putative membrane protein
MYLEMVAWDTPSGRKAFRLTPEFARASRTLAANQGLYNGFLAAGLVWSYFAANGHDVRVFFLSCVVIAGIYGGLTASRAILFIQALPATAALAITILAR